MNKQYFKWLVSQIGLEVRGWDKVLSVMSNADFVVVLPRDNNRAEEGLALRSEYFLESNDYIDGLIPCTVLELLIALARRCDDMVDSNGGVERWFFGFLNHLGFYEETKEPELIRIKLADWMSRKYSSSGFGGIFPLRHPKIDQRETELWYQMCHYIEENFTL